MTNEKFELLLEMRIEQIKSVLERKRSEYASEDDNLHLFKRAAAMLATTPADACMCFMAKHWASLSEIVIKAKNGYKTPQAVIDEKIGDAICYLILLEALLKEGWG